MTTPTHLRIWRGAGVAAAVIGSQSLVAALPQPGNALMLLPSEGAIAGLGFGPGTAEWVRELIYLTRPVYTASRSHCIAQITT